MQTVECGRCGEECADGYNLVSHLKCAHQVGKVRAKWEADGATPTHCLRCGVQCKTIENLTDHLRQEHELGAWRSESEANGADPEEPMKANSNRQRSKPPKSKKEKISEVGMTDGGLACPKCGGSQFKVKRSGIRKLGAVVAAPVTLGASALILAKGTQVRCVTCGTVFKRG